MAKVLITDGAVTWETKEHIGGFLDTGMRLISTRALGMGEERVPSACDCGRRGAPELLFYPDPKGATT